MYDIRVEMGYQERQGVALSVDYERAFDSLSCGVISHRLSTFNSENIFINGLKLLEKDHSPV